MALLAACGGGGGNGNSSPPPTSASISYSPGAKTFTVGTAITAITPTITGTLSSFTVSPALPAGLSLDSGTGTISGTPSGVTAAATYTVTAKNSSGNVSTDISIIVNDIPPSQVSYGAQHYSFSATVASSTLTPNTAGATVVSWSINPALPAGLDFSTTDGSISGTPTAVSPATAYVVTAQNSGGQSTVTVILEVDAAPLLNLGHQGDIAYVRVTATNALSEDSGGNWLLWDYSRTTVVAGGVSGCAQQGCPAPWIDMAGSVAVMVTPTGFEVRSSTDGHILGTIATPTASWWKLATDGSYIAAGSTAGLSAWSPSGQLLFTRQGDYSHASGFAAPTQVLVGAGPAGANVVETVAVPSGASTTGPQFNGQFASWFTDGGRFITTTGTTVLIYSNTGTQQGSIDSVAAKNITIVGQGNWVWAAPVGTTGLNTGMTIYPAVGTNPAAAATYTYGSPINPSVSGLTLAIFPEIAGAVRLVDLSGAAPIRTDYTLPGNVSLLVGLQTLTPFAAVSPSQWVAGGVDGVLVDGPSLAGTARYFGFGKALSIVGGTGHFAIATALGQILYFNSATLAQEGQIALSADQLAMSADGSVLVAQGFLWDVGSLQVYTLPAGSPPQYTWPLGAALQEFDLSGSGTVLGQLLFETPNGSALSYRTQQASAVTGGPVIFSKTDNTPSRVTDPMPPTRISPDGTLIAFSQTASPTLQTDLRSLPLPVTNLLLNGTPVATYPGLPVGWMDNSRLLVNNYELNRPASVPPLYIYSGCTLYGPSGSPTGAPCALPGEVPQFQPVGGDTVYVPVRNQVLSVSTGAVGWASANLDYWLGTPNAAVAGSRVIFMSGTNVLAQSY